MKHLFVVFFVLVIVLTCVCCSPTILDVPKNSANPQTPIPTQQTVISPLLPPTAVPETTPITSPTTVPVTTPTTAPIILVSPSPKVTSSPDTTPEPNTNSNIKFSPSKSLPLPNKNEKIPYGQSFHIGGTVSSNKPLTSVFVTIEAKNSSNGRKNTYTKRFSVSDNVRSYELIDPMFPAKSGCLSNLIPFSSLSEGTYIFKLYASNADAQNVMLSFTEFSVVKSGWIQLVSNNFRNNYEAALSFFKDRERFMFRYKWSEGRHITIDPQWVKEYITSVATPNGSKWTVHKDAVAPTKQALKYLDSTYVRIRGTTDTGVIKLYSLIKEFNGSYVPRYVSDKTFISHHSFGAAFDINANMDMNQNILKNRSIISKEVTQNLKYNGIKELNGTKYYDFTYSGNWSNRYKNTPTSIINYLLYELAFYRAGFGWGYYYRHACDGMHFTLTELSTKLHETSNFALRKVYTYIP